MQILKDFLLKDDDETAPVYEYKYTDFGLSIDDIIYTDSEENNIKIINWKLADDIRKELSIREIHENDIKYVVFSNKFCEIYTIPYSFENHEINFLMTAQYLIKTKENFHFILHRKDKPCIRLKDGTRIWYKMGRIHRENGPAKIERKIPDISEIEESTFNKNGYEYWIDGNMIKNISEFKNIKRCYLIDKMIEKV